MNNAILSSLDGLMPVMMYVGAIVMGLMQVTKAFKVSKTFLPIFAIAYAILFSFVFLGFSNIAVVVGFVTGLSTMGLWSGAKTVATK